MNLEQLREADRLADELADIEHTIGAVAPERADYAIDPNTNTPTAFHVTGEELHAWLEKLKADRIGRLQALGVEL